MKSNRSQLNKFYEALKNQPKTNSMVCSETGLTQKNTCRYKRALQKANKLWEIKKDICKITGYKATYLTTNESLKPPQTQLQLFS